MYHVSRPHVTCNNCHLNMHTIMIMHNLFLVQTLEMHNNIIHLLNVHKKNAAS